ncbi:unnamed protein product [Caenorhabditis sp. 36 PRJEB53466]|nr:unnamed protein product [Caenorhabditis sp. 36 PRJEB53466]
MANLVKETVKKAELILAEEPEPRRIIMLKNLNKKLITQLVDVSGFKETIELKVEASAVLKADKANSIKLIEEHCGKLRFAELQEKVAAVIEKAERAIAATPIPEGEETPEGEERGQSETESSNENQLTIGQAQRRRVGESNGETEELNAQTGRGRIGDQGDQVSEEARRRLQAARLAPETPEPTRQMSQQKLNEMLMRENEILQEQLSDVQEILQDRLRGRERAAEPSPDMIESIDKFSGEDPDLYPEFINQFDEQVHHNGFYTAATKYCILKKCLTGEARKLVTTTTFTEEDYRKTRELLEATYAKDRVPKLMRKFKDLPIDPNDYMRMDTDISRHVAIANQLNQNGVPMDHPLMIDELIKKLPVDIMSHVVKRTRSSRMTFLQVISAIRDKIVEKGYVEQAREDHKRKMELAEICAVGDNRKYKDREPVTKLVMSKSKVKPKNVSLSIPRLELMGMEIASHASLTAYKELKNGEIEGKYNPADLASRGVVMEKLFNNSLWFDGPEFLKNPESEWPIRLEGKISYPQEFRELILKEVVLSKAAKKKLNATAALAVDTTDQDGKGRPFIPYNRVSSLAKLTTVMGLVMRWFVRKLPNKEWESLVMRQLAKAKRQSHGKSRLNLSLPTNMNLEPGEEGVYRYHRQLDNSRLSADAKNPILILRDHELATLIAREVHRMNMHIPQTYLIAAIRQKYWIPQVGTLVKQVIRRYSYSKTLPSCRTTPVAPFAHVGLDYFGPITYRTLRNKEEKAWVMLITCLLTRAVHLELVLDNSTISYLMAMSRYFARRGVPKSIVCDNAPSFKLGNEMINKDIRDRIHGSHEMTVFLATREIEIRNITPLSPWKGGVYERVVGLVKRQFYKTVNRFKLTYVELESVMIQIEGTLNNRPITSTSADERDPIALRPIDLLLPQVQISIPLQTQESQGATTEKVTREYLAGLNGVLKKSCGWSGVNYTWST